MCMLLGLGTHTAKNIMRTNIVIDDQLIADAQQLAGLRTKREAVEAGLRLLVQIKRQERLRTYRGKLRWEGDLDTMRRDG